MKQTSKLQCHMRTSDVTGSAPGIVRRRIECRLQIEGRDERLSISGTLIGRRGSKMIVENADGRELGMGPAKAAKLLAALYEVAGVGCEGEIYSSAVTDFEVVEADGGIIADIIRDLSDAVWE